MAAKSSGSAFANLDTDNLTQEDLVALTSKLNLTNLKGLATATIQEVENRQKAKQAEMENINSTLTEILGIAGVQPAAPVATSRRGRKPGTATASTNGATKGARAANGGWTLKTGSQEALLVLGEAGKDDVGKFLVNNLKYKHNCKDFDAFCNSVYVSGITKLMNGNLAVKSANGYMLTAAGKKDAEKRRAEMSAK